MILILHELKQKRFSFWIWTACIGGLLAVCVFLYPDIRKEASSVTEAFASMGSLTAAFGMDKLNFGSLDGFYGLECGNVLGIGGSLFAAFMASGILSREETGHTAEFLMSHPVSRSRIYLDKSAAVLIEILLMNAAVLVIALISLKLTDLSMNMKDLLLLHGAYLLLQLEVAAICMGLSAFLPSASTGIGIGLVCLFYVSNLIANLTKSAGWLKWLTPYAWCEASEILSSNSLEWEYVAAGLGAGLLVWLLGMVRFSQKDLQ